MSEYSFKYHKRTRILLLDYLFQSILYFVPFALCKYLPHLFIENRFWLFFGIVMFGKSLLSLEFDKNLKKITINADTKIISIEYLKYIRTEKKIDIPFLDLSVQYKPKSFFCDYTIGFYNPSSKYIVTSFSSIDLDTVQNVFKEFEKLDIKVNCK